jgi:hypothetical protein
MNSIKLKKKSVFSFLVTVYVVGVLNCFGKPASISNRHMFDVSQFGNTGSIACEV